jgi:eukaryotic-like serine/threonine-protein kinase
MDNHRLAGLDLKIGQIYGDRYRIVMPIGRGGMGRVYLAEDTRLGGKTRAIKLMRPLADEARSFLLEAQLLSELDHPHLPHIVDYFPPNETGVACIVMDYIAGDTLAERFERYGRHLPFPFVLNLLIQLCGVLIYLHARSPSIVFRDLKPSNVLLDRHNQAILVDFGIARRFREDRQSDTQQLGTPGFAAPEQLRGEQSDTRTDLYGLGALAYHLLSGGHFAISHRGAYKKALQYDVPKEFILLLEQLLAPDPHNRPQSAYVLLAELHSMRKVTAVETEANIQREASNDREVIVIAVASAYPGAGATFASLALSSSLSRSSISHALVECPGGEAALYAFLHGDKKMPKGAVYAEASGEQAAVPAWRNGRAAYYPVRPNERAFIGPEGAFTGWLRRLGVPIVILDVSSRWEHAELRTWIAKAVDRILMVADCYPVKWTSLRQADSLEMQQLAQHSHVRTGWIANRDQSFREREQWLSLFPISPEVILPEISGKLMLHSLWRGEGLPSDSLTVRAMDGAFHNLISSFTRIK